jgi:4-hydroxy-4-methyl-2-oxoglutarate aldolase
MKRKNVNLNFERPSTEIVEKFRSLQTATVHEALGKRGAVDSEIKPLFSGMTVCGPALTIMSPVGDNITLHKAISVACAGDVFVAAVGGYKEAGVWGEIVSLAAKVKGIEGLVIDGCVRDALRIKELGFPVFARGVSIKGTVKETLGFIGYSISFGGITVNPGDIVLGDDDGLVIVPKEEAQEVLSLAIEREEKEEEIMRKIREGKSTMELLGFDDLLKKKALSK